MLRYDKYWQSTVLPGEGGEMKSKGILAISFLVILLLALPLLTACNCDDDNGVKTPGGTPTITVPKDEVTITIGAIMDLTGVAAAGMDKILMAAEDLAAYYNDENLIPGVTLKVIHYDNQYDPAKDVPGYNRLISQGADVIFGAVSSTAIVLKPMCERDKIAMFTVAPNLESFVPPGWVFAAGQTAVDWEMQTLMKWIADNDWDWQTKGPAKVGAAMWKESYGEGCMNGLKAYCNAHPEQFELTDVFLTDMKFSWKTEVEELRDCDYVLPPVPMNQFAKEYEQQGYETIYLGTDAHLAFLDMITQQGLWDALDGMLVIKVAQWWTDSGAVMDMTDTMLQRYRPGEEEDIKEAGIAYLASQQLYVMYELIRDTVERYGAENFSSELLYKNAQSFSITVDGCPHSYAPDKRTSNDKLTVYRIDGSATDILDKMYRAEPDWIPIVYEP